ncbi:hypothetical protein OAK35_00745 [Crocinitomicaceae bacterium]|nr:hypothetical protein [Crocinitomicaceae bacterium]|mmetsp:Transcript_8756/g.11027  ORF Transcript_8756/g.11027 Transcript_8756/m.11027 type:complete len:85 (+) Transcript_8756:299-553(+)
MRLPVIKHINSFIEENDADFVHETIDFLEHLAQARGLKDEELDVIGEILSNAYGALEVQKAMAEGQSEREALNGFMQRVTGSID